MNADKSINIGSISAPVGKILGADSSDSSSGDISVTQGLLRELLNEDLDESARTSVEEALAESTDKKSFWERTKAVVSGLASAATLSRSAQQIVEQLAELTAN